MHLVMWHKDQDLSAIASQPLCEWSRHEGRSVLMGQAEHTLSLSLFLSPRALFRLLHSSFHIETWCVSHARHEPVIAQIFAVSQQTISKPLAEVQACNSCSWGEVCLAPGLQPAEWAAPALLEALVT